jgi:outer membrane protein W
MKKLLSLIVLILTVAITSHAQEFKKFKVGIGGGYASPSGSGSKGGILFYLEPAYRITDAIQVGLRMESAIVARGFSSSSTLGDGDLELKAIGSYTLNGQYYFSNNTFRPFVGAGFGIYSLASSKLEDSNSVTDASIASESKFGFYPRIGFDVRHFTLSIDYNIVSSSLAGQLKNSYLGIRIGGFFGGGRK